MMLSVREVARLDGELAAANECSQQSFEEMEVLEAAKQQHTDELKVLPSPRTHATLTF